MNSQMWKKFRKKEYRQAYVEAHLRRGNAVQIRSLMRSRGWSQQDLADAANLSRGVISRAVNPDYGHLTLSTIIRIAAGFDIAFIGRFVPFSELEKELEREFGIVPAFDEEDKK